MGVEAHTGVLEVRGLRHEFPIRAGLFGGRTVGHVRAVDGVDLAIGQGRRLGLVGESGCGKTTLGRIIVRLLTPMAGEVLFGGVDLRGVRGDDWRALRPRLQMVFQDTQSSLDPRMTVEQAIAEPIRISRVARGIDVYRRVAELTESVGLGVEHLQRYPHELSGGQRQRVVIARALATEPALIVLDEPTSALDVSVQAQILNLLKDLQEMRRMTYVFISHDLGVVRMMSDEVAVMYLGEIVERGPADELFANPLHPYTRLLLESMPRPNPRARRAPVPVTDELPRVDAPPPGCRFHPRCPRAEAVCRERAPALVERPGGRAAACHFADEFDGRPLRGARTHD